MQTMTRKYNHLKLFSMEFGPLEKHILLSERTKTKNGYLNKTNISM